MLLKSEIEEVYKEQQAKLFAKEKSVKRNKFDKLTTNNDFVQIVSGIRRCGKSTLLHQLMSKYKKIAYFNFEDPRILNFEVSDFIKLEEIIPKDTQAYFFDEIQNVAKWEIFVRKLHDGKKKVYITGSNASLLSKDLGTRLTGRYLNAELFPFSYTEFLEFSKSSKSVQSVEKYLEKGGFPEYLKQENTEVLQNLLKDIVLRDIAIRYGIRNIKTLMDITLFLLSNVGKENTYNGLKKTFEIGSANTVLDYLTWLEDAYLVFFLQKFSWSAKSRNINPRKVYAIDNGFITANSLSFSKDKGRLLENAVYLHYRSKGLQMYYFKEKQECDFVLFKNNNCQSAIQVCYELNSDNKERELNGLLEAMTFFDLKEGEIITLKQSDVLKMGNKKIRIIPMLEFLSK